MELNQQNQQNTIEIVIISIIFQAFIIYFKIYEKIILIKNEKFNVDVAIICIFNLIIYLFCQITLLQQIMKPIVVQNIDNQRIKDLLVNPIIEIIRNMQNFTTKINL